MGWKLVIDTTNAPALADFWAAALEYEVEDPSALIEQPLAAGHIGADAVIEHRGRKIFRGYAAIRHSEDPYDQTSGVAWAEAKFMPRRRPDCGGPPSPQFVQHALLRRSARGLAEV